jgi:membrane-associated protease RseP (regulator of RpoE activity)
MPESDPHKPPRDRRPRGVFWLCVLCIVAVATAVGMSVWVPRLQRQRALDEISRLGGTVYAQPPSPNLGERLLRELSGSSSRRVVAIDLSSGRLNDDKLDLLNEFPRVRFLTLSGTDLSDDGIRRLNNLEHLERLVLVNCPQISEAAERDLQTANPGLRIFRRGPALLGVMGEPGANGCRIVGVREGTAAHRDGVLVGDVITAFNGRPITNFDTLARQIARHRPGEEVILTIIRRGQKISLAVKLGSWERQT